MATGSKRAGEVLTEPALMALTEGAFRLAKPALSVAKTGLKTAVNTVRHLEVTVDSAAFLRHNAGIPFDAVKITTKTPKVEVPTAHAPAAPAAPKVAEASVSRAPSNVIRKPVKVVTASGETVVQNRISGLNGELFERHHILSDKNKIIINHPLLEEIGYDLQKHQMYLPTKEGGEVSTTFRTIHEGKHVDKYSRDLARRLDEIRAEGKVAGYTREQYIAAVDELVTDTRIKLKDGEIHLNKNTRESLGLPLKGDPQ